MLDLAIVAVVSIFSVLVYAIYLERACNRCELDKYLDELEENERVDEYMYRVMTGEIDND